MTREEAIRQIENRLRKELYETYGIESEVEE